MVASAFASRPPPSISAGSQPAASRCWIATTRNGIGNVLGQIRRAWFSGDALVGLFSFADTPQGRMAEQMVARGEIRGVSIGYRVNEWEVRDDDGRVLNPDKDRIPLGDDLVFEAKRWELLEASLVSVPADASASIRSLAAIESGARGAIAGDQPGRTSRQEGRIVNAAKIEAKVRKNMLDGLCRSEAFERADRLDALWLQQILIDDDRVRRGLK
ncbi:hypothetical protein ACVWWO_006450 [Bradyrhizobium sp. F1.13.1]